MHYRLLYNLSGNSALYLKFCDRLISKKSEISSISHNITLGKADQNFDELSFCATMRKRSTKFLQQASPNFRSCAKEEARSPNKILDYVISVKLTPKLLLSTDSFRGENVRQGESSKTLLAFIRTPTLTDICDNHAL